MLHQTNYKIGEDHYKWTLCVYCYQKAQSYKYILFDKEDDQYIGTGYLTPSIANEIGSMIEGIIENSNKMESIFDIYEEIRKNFYSSLFYYGNKNAPQLTDGIILLSNESEG